MARSWADLPVYLLQLILELLSFVDYIRFPAVCSSWRDVHKDHRLQQASSPRYKCQMPLMMLGDPQIPQKRVVYNPSEQRYYWPSLPSKQYHNNHVSKHGWFLGSSNNFLLLFNLFTASRIRIPCRLLDHLSLVNNSGSLSTVPTDPDCVLLCQFSDSDNDISFLYRFRDKTWTTLDDHIWLHVQPIFCGGKCYHLLYYEENLTQVEILPIPAVRHLNMVRNVPQQGFVQRSFLVECDGHILLRNFVRISTDIYKFEVFKANLSNMVWVELESLGDNVLFLSSWGHSFSLSAAETQGPGNRIYWNCFPTWKYKDTFAEYDYGSHQFMNSRLAGPMEHYGNGIASMEWIVPSLC